MADSEKADEEDDAAPLPLLLLDDSPTSGSASPPSRTRLPLASAMA